MDHRVIAEQLLSQVYVTSDEDRVQLALTHALLGLCDRLDELAYLPVAPYLDDD